MTELPNEDRNKQPDMFAEPEARGGDAADSSERRPLSARNARALERLRDRIQLASKELRRLRQENAQLHRQLEDLQTHGLGSVDGTPIVFTESASALRRKVEGFIESIDEYLAPREDVDSVTTEAETGGPA